MTEEMTVESVLLDLLSDPTPHSQEAIIEAFEKQNLNVCIMKYQRPLFPFEGDWLCYNEDHSIIQTFKPERSATIYKLMEERDSYREFFWTHVYDKNILPLCNVPCNQEQGW